MDAAGLARKLLRKASVLHRNLTDFLWDRLQTEVR